MMFLVMGRLGLGKGKEGFGKIHTTIEEKSQLSCLALLRNLDMLHIF